MAHVIEFLLLPQSLGLDITGPLEVFDAASKLVAQKQNRYNYYQFIFTAEKAGPVKLSSGLSVYADHDFSNNISSDTLLIPGCTDIESVINNPVYMNYIKAKATSAPRVTSVCKGAFALAATGLLDNKKATTHWALTEELQCHFPNLDVKADSIYVKDGKFYSSAGVTAGIDLALALVESDLGVDIALETARLLVLYFKRPGTQNQFSDTLKAQKAAGEQFAKLYDWLSKNIQNTITVEEMAEACFMSPRNFARVFKIKTGMTPSKYLETLRLDMARDILLNTDKSFEQIARLTGFGREETFRRTFVKHYGINPSQYRLHNKP